MDADDDLLGSLMTRLAGAFACWCLELALSVLEEFDLPFFFLMLSHSLRCALKWRQWPHTQQVATSRPLFAPTAGISTSDAGELASKFAEILNIDKSQAEFFLAASNNNLEAAVNLWLDTVSGVNRARGVSGGGLQGRRFGFGAPFFSPVSGSSSAGGWSTAATTTGGGVTPYATAAAAGPGATVAVSGSSSSSSGGPVVSPAAGGMSGLGAMLADALAGMDDEDDAIAGLGGPGPAQSLGVTTGGGVASASNDVGLSFGSSAFAQQQRRQHQQALDRGFLADDDEEDFDPALQAALAGGAFTATDSETLAMIQAAIAEADSKQKQAGSSVALFGSQSSSSSSAPFGQQQPQQPPTFNFGFGPPQPPAQAAAAAALVPAGMGTAGPSPFAFGAPTFGFGQQQSQYPQQQQQQPFFPPAGGGGVDAPGAPPAPSSGAAGGGDSMDEL